MIQNILFFLLGISISLNAITGIFIYLKFKEKKDYNDFFDFKFRKSGLYEK
jgi:hypothetical protein